MMTTQEKLAFLSRVIKDVEVMESWEEGGYETLFSGPQHRGARIREHLDAVKQELQVQAGILPSISQPSQRSIYP